MARLISFKEYNPSQDGLYFTLDNFSFASICIFEKGKWYKLNCSANDAWNWPSSKKKAETEMRKEEITGHDYYWLEE